MNTRTYASPADRAPEDRRPRFAIVISHPIQHFCPMYRAIAQDGRVDVRVIFAEAPKAERFDSGFGRVVKWQSDILEGYDHTFVSEPKERRSEGVLAKLQEFAPDVIYVHGYAYPYLRASMRWARGQNIPILMTTDSELLHARPLHVRMMKRLALPPMLRQVDLFLTVGDENERYYRHYGVPEERMKRVTFPIDSEYYKPYIAKREEVREKYRSAWGLSPETVVFLTVGKLIRRKGQADLIRAFGEAVKQSKRPAVLMLAGDGPERAQLEILAAPLGGAVRMPGFVGVDELPNYYLASDVYVHPSVADPHPLAISEALYCSLPVIASDRIGSIGATDDVQPGRNGWVFPLGDVSRLAECLVEAMEGEQRRCDAAVLSRALGEVHAADYVARGFVEGALESLRRKRK